MKGDEGRGGGDRGGGLRNGGLKGGAGSPAFVGRPPPLQVSSPRLRRRGKRRNFIPVASESTKAWQILSLIPDGGIVVLNDGHVNSERVAFVVEPPHWVRRKKPDCKGRGHKRTSSWMTVKDDSEESDSPLPSRENAVRDSIGDGLESKGDKGESPTLPGLSRGEVPHTSSPDSAPPPSPPSSALDKVNPLHLARAPSRSGEVNLEGLTAEEAEALSRISFMGRRPSRKEAPRRSPRLRPQVQDEDLEEEDDLDTEEVDMDETAVERLRLRIINSKSNLYAPSMPGDFLCCGQTRSYLPGNVPARRRNACCSWILRRCSFFCCRGKEGSEARTEERRKKEEVGPRNSSSSSCIDGCQRLCRGRCRRSGKTDWHRAIPRKSKMSVTRAARAASDTSLDALRDVVRSRKRRKLCTCPALQRRKSRKALRQRMERVAKGLGTTSEAENEMDELTAVESLQLEKEPNACLALADRSKITCTSYSGNVMFPHYHGSSLGDGSHVRRCRVVIGGKVEGFEKLQISKLVWVKFVVE